MNVAIKGLTTDSEYEPVDADYPSQSGPFAQGIMISDNTFHDWGSGLAAFCCSGYLTTICNAGSDIQISNNIGLDPLGELNNPWSTSTGTVGLTSGNGESAPETSGATYTLVLTPQWFQCSGGGTVSVVVKTPSGVIYWSYTCSTLPATFWPIGWSLTISNSSDFTSFYSFGK